MRLDQSVRGPAGFHWLWNLLYCRGFLIGFAASFFISPILMILIGFAVTHSVASWDGQYKGFILGDPFLAVLNGLLALLVQRPSQADYVPQRTYWYRWLGFGMVCSSLFILYGFFIGKLHLSQLLEPHLFYHHILLISFFVCAIGGMGYLQYRRHPRSRLMYAVLFLFALFLSFNVWDMVHPPVGMGP
jgi:hypothetical protein